MEILIAILKVIILICGVYVFFKSIAVLAAGNCGYYVLNKISGVIVGSIGIVVSLAMMIGSACAIYSDYDENKKVFYENIKNCVNNEGYTVYINGFEVELSHITIEGYSSQQIYIKDDIKEIHIIVTN